MRALEQISGWGARTAAAGVTDAEATVATDGAAEHVFRWASVTKPVTALATLVAVEEGIVDLDEPAGPPGSTLRHLLAHASGLPPDDGPPLAPTLVAPETLAEATQVQFPGLAGVLPSFGRHDPNDWGLGFELRGEKRPHWTGSQNSPRTFGHFGAAGTFLWVDPDAGLACAALTDREFGDWAKDAWPRLSDAVLAAVSRA